MDSESTAPSPEQARPALHEEIDRLADDDVLVLHRVAMQLELERLSERLDEGFDRDRSSGKPNKIPDLIDSARAYIRDNAA